MTLLEDLATQVVATRYGDLPAAAVRAAKLGILDALGVALAASSEGSVRLLFDVLPRDSGVARVWGRNARLSAYDAALANATAAHALDYDDCNNVYGGHPSAHLVPAVLALADELGSSGEDVLLAYAVGFEAQCKLGRCDRLTQYARGWHPTTTIGVFGAAAACARLLDLDRDRTVVAMAIACSLASGIKANFGTMVKAFQVGHCARSGVMAARLAAAGYSAEPGALEHAQGYFNVFNGIGQWRPLDFGATWGRPWEVIEPGIVFKQYPCCGSTHPAVDAVMQLRDRLPANLSAIRHIDCAIHELCLRHTNRPAPTSGTDAKFSLQYCVARAVADGGVCLDDFTPGRIDQPSVRDLMARMSVRPYTSTEFPRDNLLGALVSIGLADGTRLDGRIDEPVGASSAHPLPDGALRRKFLDCAASAHGDERAMELLQLIENLEALGHVGELTDRL